MHTIMKTLIKCFQSLHKTSKIFLQIKSKQYFKLHTFRKTKALCCKSWNTDEETKLWPHLAIMQVLPQIKPHFAEFFFQRKASHKLCPPQNGIFIWSMSCHLSKLLSSKNLQIIYHSSKKLLCNFPSIFLLQDRSQQLCSDSLLSPHMQNEFVVEATCSPSSNSLSGLIQLSVKTKDV